MVYEEKKNHHQYIITRHLQTHVYFSHMAKDDLYAWLLKAEALSQSSATRFLEVKSIYIVYFCYLFTHYTEEFAINTAPCGSDIGKHGIGLLPKHICRSPSCSSSLSRVLQQCISAVLLNRSLLWRRKNAHCANTHNLERYQNFVTVWCLQRNLPPPTHRTFCLI